MAKPDIKNLQNCTEEARQAALDSNAGPQEPNQYHLLLGRLQTAKAKIPPLYLDSALTLISKSLSRLAKTSSTRFSCIGCFLSGTRQHPQILQHTQ